MACADDARAKAKTIAINLIIASPPLKSISKYGAALTSGLRFSARYGLCARVNNCHAPMSSILIQIKTKTGQTPIPKSGGS